MEFSELYIFTQVPVPGQDIYYLRNIIHDWPDEESLVILQNVQKAMGVNSRVLIHDYVVRQLNREQAALEASKFRDTTAPEPMLPNFGVGNMRIYQQDVTMRGSTCYRCFWSFRMRLG